MALGLIDIHWPAPWLTPWRAVGEPLADVICAGQPQPEVLTRAALAPVRFVPQADLPPGMAYEQFIYQQRAVPTREGLHDFFNALCWMRFPQAKLRLNQLQAAEIALAGVQAVRGPVRDAITVLDENAALLQAPDALWDALAARQWQRLFGELRPLWAEANVLLFGHALTEKLVQPYTSITAHVWRVPQGVRWSDQDVTALDAWLAADLTVPKLAAKPFVPLPVLGVPGWWAANQDAAFYDDTRVFRPERCRAGAVLA